MATNQAKVRCPHCSVQFGFQLPQKYLHKPKKKIKFACAYCTEKFSQPVLELFAEDGTGIVVHKIRHQSSSGLQLYSNWESFRQVVTAENIGGEESISAFGGDWKPISAHEEMHDIFPPEDVVESPSEEEVAELAAVEEPPEEDVAEEEIPEVEVATEDAVEEVATEESSEAVAEATTLEEEDVAEEVAEAASEAGVVNEEELELSEEEVAEETPEADVIAEDTEEAAVAEEDVSAPEAAVIEDVAEETPEENTAENASEAAVAEVIPEDVSEDAPEADVLEAAVAEAEVIGAVPEDDFAEVDEFEEVEDSIPQEDDVFESEEGLYIEPSEPSDTEEPNLTQEDVFLEEIKGNIFEQTPSDDEVWEEDVVDPFDIPVNAEDDSLVFDESDDEEHFPSDGGEPTTPLAQDQSDEEDLADMIAYDAVEGWTQEDSEPPEFVDEPISEEVPFVISEETPGEVQSIDALLSSLEGSLNQPQQDIGTNTLDLLQSEEEDHVDESAAPPPVEDEPIFIDNLSEDEPEEDSLENMKTVIDEARFLFSEDDEDQDIQQDEAAAEDFEKNVTLATVSFLSEEGDSEDPLTSNVGEDSGFGFEEDPDISFSDREDFAYIEEDDSQDEFVPSESVDYDQTEDEESQSILNPAFQVSTKTVAKRNVRALGLFVVFGVVISLTIASYLPITEVSKMFVSVEDAEIVRQEDVKAQKVKEAEARDKKKTENKEKDAVSEKQINPVSQEEKTEKTEKTEKNPAAKEDSDGSQKSQTAMKTTEVEGGSFYNEKPLSRSKKIVREKKKQQNVVEFSIGDLEQITRQGWIKIEDRSYPSAINYFTRVVEQQPNARALLGLGYAEELMADRYKRRNDFENVEKQYDKAHKHYCSAMEFFSDRSALSENERFELNYIQARLRMISRGCT